MTKQEFLNALESAKTEEEFYKAICRVGYESYGKDAIRINLIGYVLNMVDDRVYDYVSEEGLDEDEADSCWLWTFSDEIIKAARESIGDKD